MKNDVDFFTVKNPKSIMILPGIVGRKKSEMLVNTYCGSKVDKTGKPIFTMGWDKKPESDFGRYTGTVFIVRVVDPELVIAAENAIRKGLDWPELEGNSND